MNYDKLIFRDLFKSSKGLFVYSFHTRYSMTPKSINDFLTKYKDYINYDNDRVVLNDSGRNYVLKNKFSLNKKREIFSNIPKIYLGNKIEINSIYTPNSKKFWR